MRSYLEYLDPRSLKELNTKLQRLINKKLWLKILIALVAGVTVGVILSPDVGVIAEDRARTIGNWLALPGNIFLGLIQMIVVPLVFTSIITGLASGENTEQLKKIGIRAVVFFVITTVLAIILGIFLANMLNPGSYIDPANLVEQTAGIEAIENDQFETPTADQLPGLISEILPDNPLGSMVEKEMLQIVIFAVIFGIALLAMAPSQSKILLDLLSAIQEVSMTVVKWAMELAPIAVFGLSANTAINTGIDSLFGMLMYMGTVILGLVILMVAYILMVTIFVRKSPWWFLRSVRDVQLLAFSTSSSAAVMPLSIQTAEDKLGVRPSTAQFLIPLGATINMAGTALYQGVATIFLAQVYQVDLGLPALALIVVTTVGASIGSPATPGVGIVILATILGSVGIPTQGIALILGVDRILDMSRTALNVTGDLTACMILDKWQSGKN